MQNEVQETIAYWSRKSVPHLPGAKREAIAAFERAHGIRIPPAMREFYLATEGTQVSGTSGIDGVYAFWPLQEVRRFSEFPWAFIIADHLDESWWFAIDVTGEGGAEVGAIYLLPNPDGPVYLIAHDFYEFLRLYRDDDARLYPPTSTE